MDCMQKRGGVAAASASAVLVACVSGWASASAQVAIYPGPSYTPPALNGARTPTLPFAPGRTAGDGVGIGFAEKLTNGTMFGYRAYRWDTTGAQELGLAGSTTGSAISYAFGINSAGVVVGTSDAFVNGSPAGSRAVRWDPGSVVPTALGPVSVGPNGTSFATAYAINDAGTIVGGGETYVSGVARGYRAARWDAGSTVATVLGNLGTTANGTTQAFATAVNAGNTAIGYGAKYVEGAERGFRAIRWDAGTVAAIELGDLGVGVGNFGQTNFSNSRAYAINTQGTIVGFANKYTVSGGTIGTRAVRWDGGSTVATELGNLGTLASGSTTSEAYDINDSGTAVGFAQKYVGGSSRGFRAVRWDAGSTVATELGILGTFGGGLSTSYAYAINEGGIAVGYVKKYTATGTLVGDRAVYWGPDGEAVDLNTLLSPTDAANWTLNLARDISDTGWITGLGLFDPDGAGPLASYNRMFLMQIATSSCAACAADFNQDGGIDGSDIGAFFAEWEQGAACADANQDGGIDGSDVGAFFVVWEAGGC